jgi:hypothetical protein
VKSLLEPTQKPALSLQECRDIALDVAPRKELLLRGNAENVPKVAHHTGSCFLAPPYDIRTHLDSAAAGLSRSQGARAYFQKKSACALTQLTEEIAGPQGSMNVAGFSERSAAAQPAMEETPQAAHERFHY